MAQTQINGGTQVQDATITNAKLAGSIADNKLATSYIKADGTRAFTGEVAGVTPTAATSFATKGYVDTIAQGLDPKPSARTVTDAETLTIASGTVTQIAGTTAGGIAVNVGEYILIPNAPSATGAASGSTFTSQPANGLYKVTANSTNLTVSRAPEQSGSVNPAGDYVFVESGTVGGISVAAQGYTVTTPASNSAFSYGTGNIAWTQFSGAGQITVDASLTKSGNQLGRAALTGDVTASAGSNATTIANGVVSLGKLANLAANSVIANTTGSSATPTALGLTPAATASTAMLRDANANVRANSVIENFQSIATSAGTSTLTVSSPRTTQFTGSTTHTLTLPDATTLVVGQAFTVTNRSSANVTINTNGGSLLQTMVPGSFLTATVTGIGTAAGTWDAAYTAAGGSGSVTSVSVVSANGLAGTVANASTTPAITLSTSVTGVLKGNGTAISAATAGTDYLAASSLNTRETPTGSINGSNTAFSLAVAPTSGTEMVFLNGILQDAGAGNDYQISSTTITFASAPVSGDKIRVTYWHS